MVMRTSWKRLLSPARKRTGRTRRAGRTCPDHAAREGCRAPDWHRAATEACRSQGFAGFDPIHADAAGASQKLAPFRALNRVTDALHRHVGTRERVDQRTGSGVPSGRRIDLAVRALRQDRMLERRLACLGPSGFLARVAINAYNSISAIRGARWQASRSVTLRNH